MSEYVDNCVREVRQSVLGRDNRAPIANAVQKIYDDNEGTAEIIISTIRFADFDIELIAGDEYRLKIDPLYTG